MVFSCLKNDYLQVKGGLEGFPMMLVGNKCDEEAGGQLVTCFWKWVLGEVGNLSSGLPAGLELVRFPNSQEGWATSWIGTNANKLAKLGDAETATHPLTDSLTEREMGAISDILFQGICAISDILFQASGKCQKRRARLSR